VSPVKYELGSYIPEDGILHSHRRESLKSYVFICLVLIASCRTACFSRGQASSVALANRARVRSAVGVPHH
jgi:hypothetical protein